MKDNRGGHAIQAGIIYLDIPRPPRLLVDAFANVSVSDVNEALGNDTLMEHVLRPVCPGLRAVGPALTALNAPGDTLMLHRALALAQPGDVLVVVSESPSPSALWGNLVTTAARARGVVGAIIDGAARDVSDIRQVGFPVWSRFVSACGSTRLGPGSVNVPVMCGGVRVIPGDLIVADDDGVVVVPADRIEPALAGAQARMAREAEALPQLVAGLTPYELWGMSKAVQAAGLSEMPGCYQAIS